MELRVFIVEDIAAMCEMIRFVFDSIGGLRIVGSAATEAEARLWFDEHPGEWDLAVVDLILEQGSGLGVVAHAASQPDKGRLVVFSSYASPGIRAHVLRIGADAVFEKSESEAFLAWLSEAVSAGPSAGA